MERNQGKQDCVAPHPCSPWRIPLLGIMWVVMLWSRVEFSRVASVAVTVTATPSGSSGIDLEHMEHAVDPSRCATNVPQGYCLVAVQADQEGGSRPLMR